jgi:RNA polymerase sigma-70 factor, ECF subfamily
MGIEEEYKLIEQSKTNPEAFGSLYDIYYPKIANYIAHRVDDIPTAQDITSVVFYKAWHSLPKYESRGLPFSAWLYRIASNETNSYFRKRKHAPSSLETLYEETGFEVASEYNVEADYMQNEDDIASFEDFQLIQKLLLELPVKYQTVLALRFFEKKSIKDIADITGKKMNTVKSLIARGTNKLKKAFTVYKKHQEKS